MCQRFGSILQFSPHFHSWLPDGVLHLCAGGEVAFERLDPPDDRSIQMLVARIEQRIDRFVDEDDCADVADEQAVSAAVLAQQQQPTLPPSSSMFPLARPLCATSNGYSLHADLAVLPNERKKLERCLRYGLRYPFAQRRLSLRPDGKVVLKLRKPYFTGQTTLTVEPLSLSAPAGRDDSSPPPQHAALSRRFCPSSQGAPKTGSPAAEVSAGGRTE
jgi:hypothetical protein